MGHTKHGIRTDMRVTLPSGGRQPGSSFASGQFLSSSSSQVESYQAGTTPIHYYLEGLTLLSLKHASILTNSWTYTIPWAPGQPVTAAPSRNCLSLIDTLSFVAKVIPARRTFLTRMIDLSSSVASLD
jgi:hypothetical protein